MSFERIALRDDAWIDLWPDFLPAQEAAALLETLLATEPWEQRTIVAMGKDVAQPRLMSWAGALPYRYSGQTLAPREVPDAIRHLWQAIEAACGLSFNHVVLNRYRNGQDCVARHADNEPELGRCPQIAALSLGAERSLVLEHKRTRRKQKVPMPHGSLLVMGGTMQHTWRHAVNRTKLPIGERVNLTFRLLRGPPGWREPRGRPENTERCG